MIKKNNKKHVFSLRTKDAKEKSKKRNREKRLKEDKLEMKKYDPVARKHVIYKEGKIK